MKVRSTWMFGFVLALALAAPAAAQETKTQTVPGEVVFATGQRPGKPGNCSAIVFVKWKDVPGTTSATAFYPYRGAETSESLTPPFSDTYDWVATYTVEPGFHWIAVGKSWRDGAKPSDCSDFSAKQKAVYGTVARVELQVPAFDAKACNAAKHTLAARRKAVKKLQKQLHHATGNKRKRLKAKVKKAKAKRTKAAARVKKDC
jgi:hypothetical protein